MVKVKGQSQKKSYNVMNYANDKNVKMFYRLAINST